MELGSLPVYVNWIRLEFSASESTVFQPIEALKRYSTIYISQSSRYICIYFEELLQFEKHVDPSTIQAE